MIAINVKKGEKYAVTSSAGCTLTYEKDGQMKPLCTAMAGVQAYFVAPSGLIYSDDDSVDITLFNGALAALGLLGGGNTLPSGYTRLEYLESTGTQYIDTGLPCSGNTELRAVIMLTELYNGTTVYHRPFGSATSLDKPRISLTLALNAARMSMVSRFGSGSTRTELYPGLTNESLENSAYEYVLSAKEMGVAGVKTTTPAIVEEWQGEEQLLLFCFGSAMRLVGRVYSFTVKEAGELELNFVPALDSTGAPCMFDLVTRKPFYNTGTGDFVTPQSGATTYSLRGRRVLPDWGKLTENGLRRLYHAPAWYKGDAYDYAMENGYKPIVETEQPEVGYWVPVWHDREDCIELEWVETEPPVDELSTIE